MQKRSYAFIAAIIVLVGGLSDSCAAAAGSPQAWIDTPLDNSTAPLAPLSIIAHASASGGVSSIEFTIDDQPYRSVAADGERLVWREVEWTPPGPGTYRIGARGVGNNGAAGALATSLVTVSRDQVVPLPLPEPREATPIEIPDVLEPQIAPGVVAKMNANCREGPGTSWNTYGNLLEGQRAELKGRLEDSSWLLVFLTGRSSNCWIAASVVEVQGDPDDVQVVTAPLPPAGEGPPPAEVIEPEPIHVDDTPPSFTKIDAALAACPSRNVNVAAVVGDDSGLSSVVAYWSVSGGGSGQVTLNMGQLGYAGTIDPGITEGTLQIYFVATDASSARNSQRSNNILMGIPACIK